MTTFDAGKYYFWVAKSDGSTVPYPTPQRAIEVAGDTDGYGEGIAFPTSVSFTFTIHYDTRPASERGATRRVSHYSSFGFPLLSYAPFPHHGHGTRARQS